MIQALSKRTSEALIRATIWAFIGSLYGMLFIFFYNLSGHWALPLNPLIVAGTLAATLAALIYSSMRLAVIVTPIASVVCLLYVVSSGTQISLPYMSLWAAIIGAITGALYGLKVKSSRVYRADAKTLAGISSGLAVSLLMLILIKIAPDTQLFISVALACLLTGFFYIVLAPFYVNHFHNLLPAHMDGAMVGAGTSIFIALLFFVMISGVTPEATGPLQQFTDQTRSTFLSATLGGMTGGGLSGFLSEMMSRKWQDL